MMKNVQLKVPTLNIMYYRKKWMLDPKTMFYNAGYDIDFNGYNKKDGTINKTDEELKEWFKNWINHEPDKYFAFIYVEGIDEPIGEIYYYLNENKHQTGIVIDYKYRGKGYSTLALKELLKIAFIKNKISDLTNCFEKERIAATKAFKNVGFKETNNIINTKKFDKIIRTQEIQITLEEYIKLEKGV